MNSQCHVSKNSVDPDQKPGDLDLHCFQLSVYLVSLTVLKSLCTILVKQCKAEFIVHYLFFGTSKIFIGQEHYGHLLVPGQV